MIDTDKYEGHSTAWCLDDPDDWTWAKNMFTAAGKTNEVDALLIEDAPLLLAEVKRLREELDTQHKYIEWLEEFAPKAGEYNTAWDAYELAKGIHWTQMEEEE